MTVARETLVSVTRSRLAARSVLSKRVGEQMLEVMGCGDSKKKKCRLNVEGREGGMKMMGMKNKKKKRAASASPRSIIRQQSCIQHDEPTSGRSGRSDSINHLIRLLYAEVSA